MGIPELIPIRRQEHRPTDRIGRYDGGQFFSWVVSGGFAPGYQPGRPDWQRYKTWYAALHLFDADGRHVESDIRPAGAGPEAADRAEAYLAERVGKLPGAELCDIAVRPFQLTVDGIVFGLVPEVHGDYPDGEEEFDWAEFYPGGIGFFPPWTGVYDT